MAHQVETMAYAGEVPWHGLGVKVDNNMSPEMFGILSTPQAKQTL